MKLLQILALLCISFYTSHAIEWEEVDVPKSEYIFYVTQKGDDVIICGAGVRVSHDGGETFEYSNKINDMIFEGDTIRNNGILNVKAHITNSGNYLTFPKRGFVLHSTNKGTSWNATNLSSNIDNPEFFENEDGLFLAHESGFHYSSDDGRTWTDILQFDKYGDSYSNYCINKGQVYLFKESYSDTKQIVHVFDTDLQTIDSLTSDRNIRYAYVYDDLLYDYTYSDYPDGYDTLFKSTNGGANWEFELDFREKIKNQIQPNAENIEIRDIEADNGKIWLRYVIKENDTTELIYHAFSPDNGITLNKVNYDEADFPQGLYVGIFDGKIYALGYSIMVFDEESFSFKPLNYEFPITYLYRKLDSSEKAWSLVDGDGNLLSWAKKSEVWETESIIDKDDYYMTMQGAELYNIYSYSDQNMFVKIKYKDVLDTLLTNSKISEQHRVLEDGSTVFVLRDEDTGFNRIIKLDKGVISEIKSSVDGEIDYCSEDGSYMYITENDDKNFLCKGFTNSTKEDTLQIFFGEGYTYVREFSAQKNKLIFNTNDSLYISIDGGITIQALDIGKYFSRKSNIYVKANYFYYRNSFGLFRSLDGITWENLFEEEKLIARYEFDPKGFIYAYTNMGTFKSKDPVSVEESKDSHTPNISINIYPNPSSDILNFDFNGQVEKTAVIDLNGNLISCPQTLNTLDISGLSSGAYFLKITSNGKTYYRQFVKAE